MWRNEDGVLHTNAWDPNEEAAHEGEWLPDDVLAEAMTRDPGSIADLLVAVPARWRLDVLMVAADRVEDLGDGG